VSRCRTFEANSSSTDPWTSPFYSTGLIFTPWHRAHRISQFSRTSVPQDAFLQARQPPPSSPPSRFQSSFSVQRPARPWLAAVHSQTVLDLAQAAAMSRGENGIGCLLL
jgi:hypothetical protein